MKHLNRYHLGIVPLLSILAMSPSVMQSKFASRAIASVDPEVKTEVTKEEKKTDEKNEVKPDVKNEEKPVVQTEVKSEVKPEVKNEVVEGHPKLDALVAKVDKESITKDLNLSNAQILEKQKLFSESVKKEKSEFKESSEEALVKSQREKTEALIKDLVVLEALSSQESLTAEEKALLSAAIAEGKDILEGLLGSLEKNEELVAKAKEVKPTEPKTEEEKPVIADNEEPKKEEEPKVEEPKVEEPKKEVVVDTEGPKNEEPKKEEEKPVVADKEEPKKEEAKEEPKKEVCEADEKNKVLTSQVEALMKQNQQILQTMMGMAQMMVSMHQQNQGQGIYQQYQMPMPNPYMYQQPMSAGNWVYYPSGFQPSQPNIFAQPMQQPMQQQMSIYPDQMHQQQWNLRPTQYFGDPRFQSAPIMPGTFGNEAFSFNMGNSVPTITQI